jgi:hypothetical protein
MTTATNATTSTGRIDYLARETAYGTTFPRLAQRADLPFFQLTPQQLASFREHGYVHQIPILTATQIERLRDGLERIVDWRNGREDELIGMGSRKGFDRSEPMTYMQGAWTIDESIHDLVFHPAITVKVAQMLGVRRVRFWHDQVFYKPAKTGGNVAWHQDYSYWQRSAPAQHMSVWIGLDDASLENGCLHVVPGSHRWPLLDVTDLMGDMRGLDKQLSPDQIAAFKPVPIEQPTGTCEFHHHHTVHGSYPNNSTRPRRAIVLNYMADGTRSNAKDGMMMPAAPRVPMGEAITGRDFPVVIDLDALS